MSMELESILSPLQKDGCQYALYFQRPSVEPVLAVNCDTFFSASIIKVPILLAWAYLERQGELDRDEICNLDDEPQWEGSGIARLLRCRKLPYQDVLFLMISLSDNLCTNLAMSRIGVERLGSVLKEMGLHKTRAERRLMDIEARERGLDISINVQDCIRFYDLVEKLPQAQKEWVEEMLAANVDDSLLLRDLQRETISFFHKTGYVEGVLHDWGYTRTCRLFLLTQNVNDELLVNRAFGAAGQLLLG